MNNPTVSAALRLGRTPVSALVLILAMVGCATGDSPTPMINTIGPSASDPAQTHSIAVSIDSIEGTDGDIRVALYSTAETFDAREPFASTSKPATDPSVSVSFADIPNGDYAVMLYHDVNGNEVLDRNLLGMPSEPWTGSLSGSVFGAPSWDDVRFTMDGADLALSVSL